ncbi:response regulator [Stappia indica]|uniref:response regulator n=1 Tax=Stappia indica TaxID=538381 RepID=UPI00082D45B0|nr:response regulator [Stappia indica]
MLHVLPHAVFLHVEDNVNDALAFRLALEGATGNIRVRRVGSVETALELLSTPDAAAGPPFDCVVASLDLPAGRAGELARRVRQRYDSATLPLVGLTRGTPPVAAEDGDWFDAVHQKPEAPREMKRIAREIVDLWFSRARRFHC